MLKLWHLVMLDAFCRLPRPGEALEHFNGLPIRVML